MEKSPLGLNVIKFRGIKFVGIEQVKKTTFIIHFVVVDIDSLGMKNQSLKHPINNIKYLGWID